jgi:hypothetical protein
LCCNRRCRDWRSYGKAGLNQRSDDCLGFTAFVPEDHLQVSAFQYGRLFNLRTSFRIAKAGYPPTTALESIRILKN